MATNDNATDRSHLTYAIELAERGRAGARPNPVVGAVLAVGEDVIATGYRARWGEGHAERECLRQVADIPAGASLYVSLEPCAHVGRQPPCAAYLVERGIRRVVIAAPDPNPLTSGEGPALLATNGVEVVWADDDLREWACSQNTGFRCRHLLGRPWVTFKWAETADGAMATGRDDDRWVSGDISRLRVHLMRAASDAVAVGIGTVLVDDCQLTVRGEAASGMYHQPLRVVFDRHLRLPLDSTIVRTATDAPVLVVCNEHASAERGEQLHAAGVEIWRGPAHPSELIISGLEMLAVRGVNNLLLESGPRLALAFHDAGMIDEVACFRSPMSSGGGELPAIPADHPLRAVIAHAFAVRSGEDLLMQDAVHTRP